METVSQELPSFISPDKLIENGIYVLLGALLLQVVGLTLRHSKRGFNVLVAVTWRFFRRKLIQKIRLNVRRPYLFQLRMHEEIGINSSLNFTTIILILISLTGLVGVVILFTIVHFLAPIDQVIRSDDLKPEWVTICELPDLPDEKKEVCETLLAFKEFVKNETPRTGNTFTFLFILAVVGQVYYFLRSSYYAIVTRSTIRVLKNER